MYKYQCSKQDCSSTWTLHVGRLNGFVLTCPVCNKGRGIFMEHVKRDIENRNEGVEEIIISINQNSAISASGLSEKVDQFISRHNLILVDKTIEATAKEIQSRVKYKVGN